MFNGLKITVSTQRAIQEAEKIVNFTMGEEGFYVFLSHYKH